MRGLFKKHEKLGLRTIKTARTLSAINKAIRKGNKVLIKELKPSPKIRSKVKLIQDIETGKVSEIRDYRSDSSKYKTLLEWTYYYPHHWYEPYAAYILPPDLELNERVYIADLIDDYVGTSWNQGDVYRLKSSIAIWNGNDFTILYSEDLQTKVVG